MTRVAIATGLAGAVGAVSCDDTASPRDGSARGAAVDPPVDRISSPPSRGRVVGGQDVQRVVAWPAPASRDHDARAALSDVARVAVDDAPVPVLAPADPTMLARAVLTHGARWAALSTETDGLHVRVHASAQAKVYPHIKPMPGTHEVRSGMGFVTQNEGVWVASWIEHGVAYQAELECADTSAEACGDAEALVGITDALVFVGGRGQ